MGARMLDVRSTELAVRWEIWVKTFAVFAHRGMISGGAGHATHGLNIIAGDGHEESLSILVDQVRFEEPTFVPDRNPIVALIRLGLG